MSTQAPPDGRSRYAQIERLLNPSFTEPQEGWWPMENVQVGDQVGKLVSYSPTTCEVVIGGYYGPPRRKKVHAGELVKIHDRYNLRLRGDSPPSPTPKLGSTEVVLGNEIEVRRFVREGFDSSGEWEWFDQVNEKVIRRFTVKPDGTVARAFKVPPGSYEIRRRA